jgi:hypothetical protein
MSGNCKIYILNSPSHWGKTVIVLAHDKTEAIKIAKEKFPDFSFRDSYGIEEIIDFSTPRMIHCNDWTI